MASAVLHLASGDLLAASLDSCLARVKEGGLVARSAGLVARSEGLVARSGGLVARSGGLE